MRCFPPLPSPGILPGVGSRVGFALREGEAGVEEGDWKEEEGSGSVAPAKRGMREGVKLRDLRGRVRCGVGNGAPTAAELST